MARYALVIGIAQYQKPLRSLLKTTTDAEAIAQQLEQYGNFQEVKRFPARWNAEQNRDEVLNKPVTGIELGQAIKTFLLEQAKGSEALIYFTGHGITVANPLGTRRAYLVTSDCTIQVANQEIIEQQRGIDFDDLNELIRKSTLSSLVMLLDCCHSGSFLERNSIEQTLTAFSSQKDYYLITACRSFEQAYAGETHSQFTEAILQGLSPQEADRNGQVSGDRLFAFISSKLRGTGQEPIRMGWGRSINLVTHALPPAEAPIQAFNSSNPYIGLQSFSAEQASYFFGREPAVRALIDRLGKGRFLAVIGASGCGKSSLVKAGLLPELKRDRLPGASRWEIEIMTPGNQPHVTLAAILDRHAASSQPFVLFIDQFEEVFTLCQDETERSNFMRRMADTASNPASLTRVIVAIRGDFLDRCASYPEPARLINQTHPASYVVPPLTPAELEAAIEKPALHNGVTFESGLVSEIATDVIDRPGALPLLQYALLKLWQVCIAADSQPLLTRQGYQQIGGVRGALDQRASALYRDFAPADQAFVRRLFMELVQLGDQQEVTRRRADWERVRSIADNPEQLQRVVRLLASEQQRLIVTSEKTIEVAHEALLTEWTLLRNWIAENLENIRLSRSLEADCHDWQYRFNQSEDALLSGAQLAAIAEWIDRTQPKLTNTETRFVKQSLEKRDRQLQTQLDQERKLREEAEARAMAEIEKAIEAERRAEAESGRAIEARARVKAEKRRTQVAVISGLLVAILLMSLGLLQAQRLQVAKIGEVNSLISSAEAYSRSDSQLEALIAGVRALARLEEVRGSTSELLDRLRSAMSTLQERNRLEGHTESVNSVSYSDRKIASASTDKTIRLWKHDGTPIKTAKEMRHEDEVLGVSFSKNGNYLVSTGASDDATVRIWKEDGILLKILEGHEKDKNVNYATFSPDNKAIVSASDDKTVLLWKLDLNSSQILLGQPKVLPHTDKVLMAQFSPSGKYIVSTSADSKINIWKSDGSLIVTLDAKEAAVGFADFSSNEHHLVTISSNSEVRMWKWTTDIKNWTEETIVDDLSRSYAARFSPDQKLFAATSGDGKIRLWNSSDYTELRSLGRHQDIIFDLSFRADSKAIASASLDKTVRIWSLDFDNDPAPNQDRIEILKQSCSWVGDYLNTNTYAKANYQDVAAICNSLQMN